MKPGERVRFDNGHAFVNGYVTRVLDHGMVKVATSMQDANIPALTYTYPYADVRIEAP